MKFLGEYKGLDVSGNMIVKLSGEALNVVDGSMPGEYEFIMERKTEARTLKQNALLWAIITEINVTENGTAKAEDDIQIYKNILRLAGTGTSIIMASPEVVTQLEKIFKIVDIIDEDDTTCVCKCYLGTSQMNVEQMGIVIDAALDYAKEIGLDTRIWM